MSSDLQLQQHIIEELEFTPDVYAEHVGVAVRNGVVTLSGHVQSFHEKWAAIEAARRVRGVKAMAQELTVDLPCDARISDDEIAARAARMLEWDTLVPKGSVRVMVSAGVVTLYGEVAQDFQRQEAEDDIRKLSGVKNVINDIRLHPRDAVHPNEVHRLIRAALGRNVDIGDDRITVRAEGAAVVLGGSARTLRERTVAERAAWDVPGVVSVENHIEVAINH